jgi:putative ATPase
MGERRYYMPAPRGLEIKIGEKLARLRGLDRERESRDRRTSEAGPDPKSQ